MIRGVIPKEKTEPHTKKCEAVTNSNDNNFFDEWSIYDQVLDHNYMCLCSRVASGRVVRSPGLTKRGFVAGDNLQPWKARLLLSLALTKTTNADEIQRMFDTY